MTTTQATRLMNEAGHKGRVYYVTDTKEWIVSGEEPGVIGFGATPWLAFADAGITVNATPIEITPEGVSHG